MDWGGPGSRTWCTAPKVMMVVRGGLTLPAFARGNAINGLPVVPPRVLCGTEMASQ